MPIDLRRFRYFVAVAEELHFGRAAARLGIAQPPLSQQIRQLEDDLGARLFERTSRSVALTPAAESLLADARRILREVEAAADRVRQVDRGEAGLLRIGFVGSAIDGVLPGIVRRFREQVPGARLSLQELTSAQQVAALAERSIDVGFVRPPVVGDGLTVIEVVREQLVLALPADHALVSSDMVRLADLASEPFVMFRRDLGEGLFDQVQRACIATGFEPQVAQEANQMHTIVGLVAAGLGVALVPQSVSRLRPDDVVYRSLSEVPVETTLAIAWRARDREALLARFVACVMKTHPS